MSYPLGSQWRKWDLHVHTPASFHWNSHQRYHQITEDEAISAVNAINNSDVEVFAIQDYWTFDGYLKIREVLSNPDCGISTQKTIFPGIELRIEAPIQKRLNAHVIFSDALTQKQLEGFLTNLHIRDIRGGISGETIVEAVRKFMTPDLLTRNKGKDPKKLSDNEAYTEGCEWITVTLDSLERALQELPEKSALIMFPFSPYNGLKEIDLKQHGQNVINLMRLAHLFEERKQEYISSFYNVPQKLDSKIA